MLMLFFVLFVLAAAAGRGWLLRTRAQNEAQNLSYLAKEGMKRITDVPRNPDRPRPLKREGCTASRATATSAQPDSAVREIAGFLTKKHDPAGPWQRGMRTY
jgi:hypothetical protein